MDVPGHPAPPEAQRPGWMMSVEHGDLAMTNFAGTQKYRSAIVDSGACRSHTLSICTPILIYQCCAIGDGVI